MHNIFERCKSNLRLRREPEIRNLYRLNEKNIFIQNKHTLKICYCVTVTSVRDLSRTVYCINLETLSRLFAYCSFVRTLATFKGQKYCVGTGCTKKHRRPKINSSLYQPTSKRITHVARKKNNTDTVARGA